MITDLMHLWRNLRRSPASAAAAILTLALTLGAGASIFAVLHAVLLTPLPFTDPERLLAVGEVPIDDPAAAPRRAAYATFEAWRERAGRLAALEGSDGTNLTLTGLGAAERVSALDVTPGFLRLVGITPALGRAFEDGDVGRPVVMLSHAFWRGRFAAAPGTIGRSLVLGGQPHTIIGVLPEPVREFDPSELWRPLPLTPAEARRAGYRLAVLARLAPHASPQALRTALGEVSRTSLPPAHAVPVSLALAVSGDAARTLGLLSAAAALAVLIAFANFAGLLLVRSIDRRRELAIRSALGARRSEIALQLLLEAQALVLIGVAVGVLLALWLTPWVGRLALEQFGSLRHREVAMSWPVIAAVAVAASACAAICAWVPALASARLDALEVLRAGATARPRELTWRRLLVTGEIALAFVLLASVTSIGGGLQRLLRDDPGFDPRGVLTLQVSVPAAVYGPDRVVSFYSTLLTALQARLTPGSVAVVSEIPLSGSLGRSSVRASPGDPDREAILREASPAYFDVMRIPVAAGRAFDWSDDASAPARVVVTRSLARALFTSEAPVGRQIWVGAGTQTAQIIGIVGDVAHRQLGEVQLPTVYRPALQAPSPSSIVVARSARPDAEVIAIVREEVGRLDGNLPVYRVRSMEDVVASSPGIPARRTLSASLVGFSSLALVLGAIGLFGVVAHDVAARRPELGIRLALGADPAQILRATLRQGTVMVGSGIAAGALLFLWVARALGSAGLPAEPFDALTVGLPAATLVLAGAAAVYPAARRAAHTDPLVTFRGE